MLGIIGEIILALIGFLGFMIGSIASIWGVFWIIMKFGIFMDKKLNRVK